MWNKSRWLVVLLIIAALQLVSCAAQTQESAIDNPPARVEPVAGTDLNRVILTAQAAKRLGIETTRVQDAQVRGNLRKVVPYAAVFYDLKGVTWVYTNPEPLTYVRARITIDNIDGESAVLSEGPPTGTTVVTTGSPELYGAEFGVGQ
jgi:hypothetical protein